MIPKLYIARTPDGSGLPLPSYTSKHHIGFNLTAAIGGPIKINPGERLRVPIGFAIGIPNGFCGQITSMDSLAEKNGIIVSDAPHILNPADRLPVFVLLQNISSEQHILHRGDFIAQLIILPVVQAYWEEIQPRVKDEPTDESQLILDEEKSDTKDKKDSFYSFRRKKTSPRNRYGTDEEDA